MTRMLGYSHLLLANCLHTLFPFRKSDRPRRTKTYRALTFSGVDRRRNSSFSSSGGRTTTRLLVGGIISVLSVSKTVPSCSVPDVSRVSNNILNGEIYCRRFCSLAHTNLYNFYRIQVFSMPGDFLFERVL